MLRALINLCREKRAVVSFRKESVVEYNTQRRKSNS